MKLVLWIMAIYLIAGLLAFGIGVCTAPDVACFPQAGVLFR